MEKNNIILGLDVSTQCIGCCLLLDDDSEYGKILELTHIVPKVPNKSDNHIKDLFFKNEIFKNDFLMKLKDMNITQVVIEEPLISSKNSFTVSTLLRFNGMISESVYNILNVVPDYISSHDAREYSFPKLMAIRRFGKDGKKYPRKKIINNIKDGNLVLFGEYPWDTDKKSVLQQNVSEIFPDIPWIYNKKGELKKENFDASDAYVACYGQLNRQRHGELDFKISNIVEDDEKVSFDVSYWDKTDTKTIYF